MNNKNVLCQSFVQQAKEALSQHPQIIHTWSIESDKGQCVLDIPKANDNGFSITVEVHPQEIIIMAGNAHTSIHQNSNPDELASQALGLVRDMLSPAMRIREYLAGGKVYKWAFELYRNEQWVTEEYGSLIFWNYFGRRTEKIYQNNTLPARENPVD
jgi:hypothetical protein